jgi:predicted DNA binding CopG/RHH family protein
MTKQHKKDPIPQDVSREELAHFWDTHSIADYKDELKPVQVRFTKKFSEPVTIRLDQEILQKVRQEASEKGIGATTLIRMMIYEQYSKKQRPSL